MKGWLRDLALALVSAVFGALAAYSLQVQTADRPELTILKSSLHSSPSVIGMPPDKTVPDLLVHQFSIKNTGDTLLTDVQLSFDPGGGDAAYDPSVKQTFWHSGLLEERRTGRLGSKIARQGNRIVLTYDRFEPGEVDTLSITNDGIAHWYDVTTTDPALALKVKEASTELQPDYDGIQLSSRLFGLKTVVLATLLAALLASAATYFLVLRPRKERDPQNG